MKLKIPSNAKTIINTLGGAGFEAYVVGGCVRSALMGIKIPLLRIILLCPQGRTYPPSDIVDVHIVIILLFFLFGNSAGIIFLFYVIYFY